MRAPLWLVTEAILADPHGPSGVPAQLHPALDAWAFRWRVRRRRAYRWPDRSVLEWWGLLNRCPPSVLLASRMRDALPSGTKQVWVASPMAFRLFRDRVQVAPEGEMDWHPQAAEVLARLLDPLLEPVGLKLCVRGSAMVLASTRVWDVEPPAFGALAGNWLPDRLPAGRDAGAWMRLQAEIQMLLHRGADLGFRPSIDGLWFWGGAAWPAPVPERPVAVAGRHPVLLEMAPKEARLVLSEAARLPETVGRHARPPRTVLLAGSGQCWFVRSSILNRRRSPRPPARLRAEADFQRWLDGFV